MGVSWGDPEPKGTRLKHRTLLRGSQATAPGLFLRDGLGAPVCSRVPMRPRVTIQFTRVTHHPQGPWQS